MASSKTYCVESVDKRAESHKSHKYYKHILKEYGRHLEQKLVDAT